MKKSTYILWGVILILSASVILLVIRNSHLRSGDYQSSVDTGKTDTVYVSRFFDREDDLKIPVIPNSVFFYFTDSIPVKDVNLQGDKVTLVIPDSTMIHYNTSFLTQFPNAPKFLQMKLNKRLELTFLNTQGKVYTESFQIDPSRYNYSYTDHLTSERKSFFARIQPYTQLTLRPIHTMVDLDLGLSYKTKRMQYEFGLNGFYYPSLPSHFGADVFLRVRYNF